MDLVVDKVTKKFGNLSALQDCSIEVSSEKISGLIGPNGSGKTTLYNVITGFLRPNSGVVTFGGSKISGKRPSSIAKMGVVRTFQMPRVFSQLTVYENVRSSARSKLTKQQIDEMLVSANLPNTGDTVASSLSFGQKKSLEIIRALALQPKLLCLDEPTSGLDPIHISSLVSWIKDIQNKSGIGVLVIEHNMNVVMNLAEHISVLHNGTAIASGTPAQVQANSAVIDAYLGTE